MKPIELKLDQDGLDRKGRAMITVILKESRLSIAASTRWLEKRFEAKTRAAVPGRLWQAWGSEVYPGGGRLAYAPVGEVFANGKKRTKGAITYWTQPGVNRKASGEWLAIPTKEAGVLNRTRNVTPGEWERTNGVHLQFVYGGPGKASRLVAEHVVFGANGIGVRIPTKRRLHSKGSRYINNDGSSARVINVTIFVLIPQQRFANKFSLEPDIRAAEKYLAADYQRRMERVGRLYSGVTPY